MSNFRPGDRVTLTEGAAYREGRGLPGTVVLTWGRGHRWAVVDVDHHGEITCKATELRLAADADRAMGIVDLAGGVTASLVIVAGVTLLALR